MAGELTADGYIEATAQEIYDELETEAISSVSGFTSIPSELRENLIQEAAITAVKCQDMVNTLLNGISPDFANDFMFIQLGNTFGLIMKDYQYASVTLTFYGTAGTIILKNTSVTNSDSSITVLTDEEITIGSTGNASVLAYADSEISETISAGVMTTLVVTNSNITSVTNLTAGTSGIEAETIEEFKLRVYNELQSSRTGSAARAYSLISQLDGVETRLIKFIEKSITISSSVYAGIEAVVGGGDDAEVAGALFHSFLQTQNLISDPSNSETDRTVTQQINLYNSTFEINFTRPKEIEVDMTVTIEFSSDISTTSAVILSLLQPTFEDFFSAFYVGQSVNKKLLDYTIMASLSQNSITPGDVISIDYTFLFDSVSTSFDSNGYLPIEVDQYLSLTDFSVVVS